MTTHTKPIVFLSHSGRDGAALRKLREELVKRTGGSIQFFLSSDGESIPFGRNWVHEIEAALNACSVMFVFVSPSSLSSPWISFESGFAYAKSVNVVPVGCFGIDLGGIRPPLGLLQGFNVGDARGLNNIIATINRVCETAFPENFSEENWSSIRNASVTAIASHLTHADAIADIVGYFGSKDDIDPYAVVEFLKAEGVDSVLHNDRLLRGIGFKLQMQEYQQKPSFSLSIGAEALGRLIPVFFDLHHEFALDPNTSAKLTLRLSRPWVVRQSETHQVSAKLTDSPYLMNAVGGHDYNGIDFSFYSGTTFPSSSSQPNPYYLNMIGKRDALQPDNVIKLVNLLFERNVIVRRESA